MNPLVTLKWIDEYGLPWIQSAARFKLLLDTQKQLPYPPSWDEQASIFKELPKHPGSMALFAVNTGCRDGEICNPKWEWEVSETPLNTSVFIKPGSYAKNVDDRLVVLNKIAMAVIEDQRGENPHYVFTYRGNPIARMLNSAWMRARTKAGLPQVRVHDLKHTFGRRLRAAGVSFEDRQDLLGHRSGRITTHYSAAELSRLIKAANRVCKRNGKQPELVVLRRLSVS